MSERDAPITERPHMPGYGVDPGPEGLLPWTWATQRLTGAHAYWLATRDADGAPHLAAVWAVWFDGALYFSTGGRSRKARDLAAEPRCALTPGDPRESLSVQGTARRVTDAAEVAEVGAAYLAKYGEGFPDVADNPLYALAPETAFGLVEADLTTSATRWRF